MPQLLNYFQLDRRGAAILQSTPRDQRTQRLFVAGSVCWIISGLDLGEPLHAGGMDFGYAVFQRSVLFSCRLVAELVLLS